METSSMDLLNNVLRTKPSGQNVTKMNETQPLNEIRTPAIQDDIVGDEESGEFQNGYTDICSICQIYMITDSCKRCGLYQYGKMFDIMTRRRQ